MGRGRKKNEREKKEEEWNEGYKKVGRQGMVVSCAVLQLTCRLLCVLRLYERAVGSS